MLPIAPSHKSASGAGRLPRVLLGARALAVLAAASPSYPQHAHATVLFEDALDGGAMKLLGPVPLEVGEGFEATEARGAELAFEPSSRAVVEFGLDDVLYELRGTPPRSRGPRE